MKRHSDKFRINCVAVLIVLIVFACGLSQQKYQYRIPEKLNDGWEVSSLKKAGMDQKAIEEITDNILKEKLKGIYSYLIVKNGKLVLEEYFKGHGRDEIHEIYSITKSFSSTLISIAIDKGFIESVEESVLDLLPQYKRFITDPKKYDIKL